MISVEKYLELIVKECGKSFYRIIDESIEAMKTKSLLYLIKPIKLLNQNQLLMKKIILNGNIENRSGNFKKVVSTGFILVFTIFMMSSMNSLYAQSTFNTKTTNGGNTASSLYHNYLSGTGINPSTVTSTVEEAMLYAKDKLNATHNAPATLENGISYSFFSAFSYYVSSSDKTGSVVAQGIVQAYNKTRVKVLKKDSSYMDYLNGIVEQMVSDLQ